MTIGIGSITRGMSTFRYSTPGKINTEDPRYKALERDGIIAGIIEEEMSMSQEERMAYEMLGGRELLIRNHMRNYDSEGNSLNCYGVAGMDATGKGESEHQIIPISEEHRQKMFDSTKREFIRDKGVATANTKRTEVFTAFQKSIPIKDRLKGTWTLGRYEAAYWVAMARAMEKHDPNWKNGMPVDTKVLKNVTRESVEKELMQEGNSFKLKGIDLLIQLKLAYMIVFWQEVEIYFQPLFNGNLVEN